MGKNTAPDFILSSILGAALFVVFLIIIDMGIIFSLIVAAAGFVSGFFLFNLKKPEVEAKENEFENALADGQKKMLEIAAFKKQIRSQAVASKVDAICLTIFKILAEIRRDPNDLKEARQFLNYYLDSTINILDKYVKLASQNIRDESVRSSISRVESMLDTIGLAFEKQLGRLLTNDVMNLDTELSLLEKTIKMEGLSE